MKVTADTNILVRALTDDHAQQSKLAKAALEDAETVAMPLCALCELVWVLAKGYRVAPADIAAAIAS